MNELQRTQYLSEMGIDVFVPRFVLPAAKLSTQAELPQSLRSLGEGRVGQAAASAEPLDSSQEPAIVPKAKVSASVSGIVSNIMGVFGDAKGVVSVEAPKKVAQPSSDVQSQTEPQATKQAAVEFSLSMWRVNSKLLVIDTRQPKQALPTTSLLHNILFAKGVQQRLPSPEVITWPMFEGVQSSGGWQEAADMVGAFLSARLSLQPAQYIWLMGDSAFNVLCSDDSRAYDDQLGAAIDLPDFSALALVLPSLTEMLLKPELKRITWDTVKLYGIE